MSDTSQSPRFMGLPIPWWAVVVLAGGLILGLNLGVRQSMGLFGPDVTLAMDWPIGVFGLALAIQNLLWGLASPAAGILAEKYGTAKILIIGAIIYTLGLVLMAGVDTPLALHGTAGVLVGLGVAATTFPIVLGAVGRAVPAKVRGLALGIVSAGGSVGQLVMAPVTQGLIDGIGWEMALIAVGIICLLMVPAGLALAGKPADETHSISGVQPQTIRAAINEASRHSGYQLLNVGFFVCGFHVAFIAVHLPNFAAVCGLPGSVAASSLALIGGFNILGTIFAGVMGERWKKTWMLSWIYGLRGIACLVFFLAPKTEASFLLFSGVMGMLWLATVPLTSGMVVTLFGTRYLASLFGIVMLSHQIGGFFGAWLGGVLFDATGSYDIMWILSAVLGGVAAVVHLPIREPHPQAAT